MKSSFWFVWATSLTLASTANAQQLELNKGDHICIVGNTLAERMQHYGWLETLIQARFPEHNLVIRNLGYSGDEIDGWKNPNHRMRSRDFGTHDEWLAGSAPCPQPGKLSSRDKEGGKKVRENRLELTNTKADVVFAFYGYNESWAGEAGLAAFQQNVEEFIKHTLGQKYNPGAPGSAPKLVLFSPIAHEFIPNDPNLPSQADVEASNARLKMYADAMGQVAKANGALFVDLFTGTSTVKKTESRYLEISTDSGSFRSEGNQMTINGVHVNRLGDRLVSWLASFKLFGTGHDFPKIDLSAVNRTVLDKNFYWFNRYRVTDGYSTYGDRAFLKFSEGPGGYGDGLSNYSVGQRELDVLDTMTSNRDKVIWAIARSSGGSPESDAQKKNEKGKDTQAGRLRYEPDDSNIPEFIPVISNKPGPLPGGKHQFLSGEEAIEKMTVGKGLKVELFADEKMFPELVNPVQMAFDTKGRLWVAAWRTYPHWKPTEPMNDKLLILEDTNGDGRADVCKTFAGDIHNPTGFEFWNGGVLVAQGPDLLFLKDTNGDDKYDIKERLVHGFDTADTHHTINSFTLDPGGAVYMQEGTFHHSQIETPWGAPRRLANGGVFRYEPRTQKTDVYVTFGFANPHGHAFDAWGQDIVVDGTGANPFHAPLFSSQLDFPQKHSDKGRPPQVYQQRTRPCSSIEVLSSSHFPEEFRGNLLVLNVIGFQGILRYKLHGSSDASRERSGRASLDSSGGAGVARGTANADRGSAGVVARSAGEVPASADVVAGSARETAGSARETAGSARETAGDARETAGDARVTAGDARVVLGDARVTPGSARVVLGDARATPGSARVVLGDARVTPGDGHVTPGSAHGGRASTEIAATSADSPDSGSGADEGSSLGATELEPILFSSDANFRPADIEVGPDGAIYFTDWQNPIIGHMQHNLRDPNRDQEHGRVYRVTYIGREVVKPESLAAMSTEKVVSQLASRDDRVRYRARIELSSRPAAEIFTATAKLMSPSGKSLDDVERLCLESLWLHQSHNVINIELLERVLHSRDFRIRAAAVRVLAAWRDDLLGLPANLPSGASISHAREQSHRLAIDLLLNSAADKSPRVRLMALWAASFIPQAEAYEVLLVAAEHPTDPALDFLSKEVTRTLQPLYDQAKKEGREIAFATEAGARFALKNLPTEELLNEFRRMGTPARPAVDPNDPKTTAKSGHPTKAICLELLYRPGLQDPVRRDAVRTLAKLDNKPELRVVMDAILNLDAKVDGTRSVPTTDTTVVFDLVRQLTSRSTAELKDARAELEKLATAAKQPIFRQIGYVSLINVDDDVDAAWTLATTSPGALTDFVNAMPLISDPSLRATLYDKIEPLLDDLPPEMRGTKGTKGTEGRIVRIELPRRGTLTLSEVEIFSNGENIARKGRATQKNTAHGGDASKAIDGGTGGIYGSGNLTHSEENTGNPWWEVDLGDEFPIDSIVVWNRTEGELGQRLDGFTIRVLDAKRSEVWKQDKNAAPKRNTKFDLPGGGGKASQVRRAAMNALTNVRGQEPKTFALLAKFVKDNTDRNAAIRALQRLPRATWPKETAPELLAVLLDAIKKTPAAERTSDAALDQFEFADALASIMPADQAKRIRAELGELGIRVIKIGTVFEKMSYDKDIIVVQAGKPIEFVLDNSDLMPHNLAITQPGALEEIGMLSEANAQKPGFAEQHYIPTSPKILAKSKLLQPRDSQRLSFNVPKQPGVYPIVCTYPGHWRRMYAALYVVPDLDAYEAAPEAYLASAKIEAVDPLLKDRRPRTEWKFEDLAQAAEMLDHATLGHGGGGRSIGTGKQMFVVANCVGCHKLDNVGKEFGPDLLKLDAKLKPSDILKELLNPSEKINEKFQTNVFELQNGKVIQGLVVEESGDIIKVVENPLISTNPITIKRNDVAERQRSKVSIMPKGLLEKMTRDEILDLVAYIASRGDKKSALFQGGHHDH